jgi:hypothetical protein
MWYEVLIHKQIDWHTVTADGFVRAETKYGRSKTDRGYYNHALRTKREFHKRAIGKSLTADDGIKQGNCHLDLVGLFGFFVAFYRQCPYFFWA